MNTKYRIDRKNMPNRMPLILTLVSFLSMDHWGAPEWLYGMVGLLLIIFWISFFYSILTSESVDIFSNDEKVNSKNKGFKETLRSKIKEHHKG